MSFFLSNFINRYPFKIFYSYPLILYSVEALILEFILKAQGKWQGLVRGFQAKTSMDGLAQ